MERMEVCSDLGSLPSGVQEQQALWLEGGTSVVCWYEWERVRVEESKAGSWSV